MKDYDPRPGQGAAGYVADTGGDGAAATPRFVSMAGRCSLTLTNSH